MTASVLIDQRSIVYCTGELAPILTGNHALYDKYLRFDVCNRMYGI